MRIRLMRCVLFVTALILSCSAAAQAEPTTVEVPGPFEKAGGALADHDGFVWYRCYVKVPDRWTRYVEGEKNLWAESVRLRMGPMRDAYEVYFNGQLIGKGGSMPPKFEPGGAAEVRHKVTPGLLKKGRYNVLAIRVYNEQGEGGLISGAPILAGYYMEFGLGGAWEVHRGDDTAWAIDSVEKRPSQAVFDEPVVSSTVMERPQKMEGGPSLSPQKSHSMMKPADDLTVDLVLSEPAVAQPVHMSFDERGRLWVVQFRQYPYPAGIKMISRDKYYRAVYDDVPKAPPHHTPGTDRITIHEDTNGDGQFDHEKVFMDALNLCNAVARGRGGVWVMHPPYLLFVPDRDGDDVPDGDPQVKLSGFGIQDSHAMASGLHWGPDGWLYFSQGSTVSSRVKVPGSEAEPVYLEATGVWRYHPATQRIEVFARGGNNHLGIEFDAAGRLYAGTNTGGTRGHHFVQGGYYPKGGAHKFGPAVNPYTFGALLLMQHDDKTPRFTHCFVRYEADALPEAYHDRLLAIDPLQRRIISSAVQPHGSTYHTAADRPVLGNDDPAFRPVDIKIGPDGHVYIADFYEFYIAHGQHYQGQIDPGTGRIYRLRGKNTKPNGHVDLASMTIDELIDQLNAANKWTRETALRLIADRRDASVIGRLKKMLDQHTDERALGALWALNLSGGLDESHAMKLLDHANPDVRRWVVRLSGDDREVSDAMARRLAERAAEESDSQVRSQLAATARRLDAKHTLPIVQSLLAHDGDVDDPMIPLMIWWAIEDNCRDHGTKLAAMFERNPSLWAQPLVREHMLERLMRRFAATGRRDDLKLCARLLEAAPNKAAASKLMTGFELAYQGRSPRALPSELTAALQHAGGGSLMLRMRQGDKAAIDEALSIIADGQADVERRRQLVELLSELNMPRAVEVLLPLVDVNTPPALAQAVLTALQPYDQPRVGKRVILTLPSFDPAVQPAALTMLASRPVWAKMLLEAIDSGRLPKSLPGEQIVRILRQHEDPDIARLVEKFYPETDPADAERIRQRIAQLRKVIEQKPGNPYPGHKLFNTLCAACHTLHGQGGYIGPNLTTYQRDDLPSMLTSIVDPNAEIREGFEGYTVTTEDGRILSGFLTDQDQHVIVLRGLDGQGVTLPRKRIKSINAMGRSLMPPGLLAGLTDQQVRDLIAYLRTGQPLTE